MKKRLNLSVNLLLSIVLLLFFVISCIKDDDQITSDEDGSNLDYGEVLIDTVLDASFSDITVSIEQGVTVSIPQGITTETFHLTIQEIEIPPNVPEELHILMAYDIELSFADEFDDYITIRYDIDPQHYEEKQESDFAMGFYHESEEKWHVFPDYEINLQQGYIECRTNHLTVVSYYEFVSSGGYTRKFQGDDVTVWYHHSLGAPLSNTLYQDGRGDMPWDLPEGHEDHSTPLYVQDVAHYIAEARDVLKVDPNNLLVSNGNINVYIKDLDGSDGEYGSVSGAIYLNNSMELPKNISGVTLQDQLKATCAHELMHLIQDNYYVMNVSTVGLWWKEATATQADRMVWGNDLSYSESEIYSIDYKPALLTTLSKSWDDCNYDPNWYLAGCFLQYMSNYREGDKLNIANSVKLGGMNTDLSLYRQILNNQINSEISSNIGNEYRDYVMYLFTEGNAKFTAISDPENNGFIEVIDNSDLTESETMSEDNDSVFVSVSVPYLATKVISILNVEDEPMQITYECQDIGGGAEAYLCDYDISTGNVTLVERLYEEDEGSIQLGARVLGHKGVFFVLLINPNLASNGEASFSFKIEEKQLEWMDSNLDVDVGNNYWPEQTYSDLDENGQIYYYDQQHTEYGRLYDWETAMVACPAGWRLPTDDEWKQLIDEWGGPEVAGGKLKSTRTGDHDYNYDPEEHPFWQMPNIGATNESGFTALPGGGRFSGPDGHFFDLGEYGYWWSATEDQFDTDEAYRAIITHDESLIGILPGDKGRFFSVRCVRGN